MRELEESELDHCAGSAGPPPLWDFPLDGVWPPPLTTGQKIAGGAAGIVIGVEIGIVQAELEDIGNSHTTYVQNGGTTGGFIQETAGNYLYYCNPFNW